MTSYLVLQELKFVFPNAQRMNRGGQVGGLRIFPILPVIIFALLFNPLSTIGLDFSQMIETLIC